MSTKRVKLSPPGLRPGRSGRARSARSSEMLHEPFELLEVAALEGAVAVNGVLADDGVARVPVRPRLGVEPEHVAGPLAHLGHHPRLRRVVVVAGVTKEDDA